MKKFSIKEDLTSDVMFEAYGKDLKELFENSALAMFSIICNTKKVNPKKSVEVESEGKNPKDLLHNWLQELIALVDTEEMFFSKFEVESIKDTCLKAKVFGESISPEKGETVVKAVTYYKFSLEKTDEGFKSVVVLDI